MERLTDNRIAEIARENGIHPAALLAVKLVESGTKSGFLSSGRPQILFEGHVFYKYLKANVKSLNMIQREIMRRRGYTMRLDAITADDLREFHKYLVNEAEYYEHYPQIFDDIRIWENSQHDTNRYSAPVPSVVVAHLLFLPLLSEYRLGTE